MNARRPSRPAFLLTELLTLMLVGVVLLGLLGKLTLTVLRVQRLAAEHANRMALMDSLSRHLTDDARNASAWGLEDGTLWLRVPGDNGSIDVRYTLTTGRVQRNTSKEDERAWQADRLTFAWHVERGSHGSVLWLDFTEQPPPHSLGLPNRTYSVATGLPGVPSSPAAAPEEMP